MVRQATETAVSASISTPDWPDTFARAVTRMPGSLASGTTSTSTCDNRSGWHSGINSWVRLAAMMPARRAVPSTSPFLALPLRTMSSVFACISTRPSAIATRAVAGLAETSTMWASPLVPIWLSFFAPRATGSPSRSERGLAGEERPRRCSDIVLAHQTFADQEGRNTGLAEPQQIVGRENAALADDDPLGRHAARQPLAGGERRLEGFQIAVVDANEPRLQPQRAIELCLVMHFDKRVHPERGSGGFQLGRASIVDRGHDDQDAIGAVSARFGDLIGVVHEILAQHRQRYGGACCAQVIEMALKRRRIGQDRKAGGAAGFISFGQRRRIEIVAVETLRRGRLLDLGDQRIVAGLEAAFDGAQKTARRPCGLGVTFDGVERARKFGGDDLCALVSADLFQNITHRSTPRSADRGGLRLPRNRPIARQ